MQPQQLPQDYQTLSAAAKLALLWDKNILPSTYKALPPIRFVSIVWKFFKLLNPAYLAVSFNLVSDELPKNRERLIHPNGSVATVEWVPEKEASVSGIFRSGAFGLARLSLAGNPHAARSYIPGMGLKLLIDGFPSVNLHVMHSLAGQGADQNFFKESFSNIIPDPPLLLWLVTIAFARVRNPPTMLDVNHLAARENDGSAAQAVPVHQLLFEPNHALDIDPRTKRDFRQELADIPPGSLLYSIFIRRTPGATPEKIGKLVTRSRFIASTYGDERLFFQHRR